MFQGASIVTTAVFSKLLFGMIIEKRHITGCGLAFIGLIIVGSSGFIESKADDGSIVIIHLCRELNYWDISLC